MPYRSSAWSLIDRETSASEMSATRVIARIGGFRRADGRTASAGSARADGPVVGAREREQQQLQRELERANQEVQRAKARAEQDAARQAQADGSVRQAIAQELERAHAELAAAVAALEDQSAEAARASMQRSQGRLQAAIARTGPGSGSRCAPPRRALLTKPTPAPATAPPCCEAPPAEAVGPVDPVGPAEAPAPATAPLPPAPAPQPTPAPGSKPKAKPGREIN